jgi:hypothetical protein
VTQLNPAISVEIINKGPALAVGSIDHGPGHELVWVVIAKDGGAITCEPISRLKGAGVYVTGQQKRNGDADSGS